MKCCFKNWLNNVDVDFMIWYNRIHIKMRKSKKWNIEDKNSKHSSNTCTNSTSIYSRIFNCFRVFDCDFVQASITVLTLLRRQPKSQVSILSVRMYGPFVPYVRAIIFCCFAVSVWMNESKSVQFIIHFIHFSFVHTK